MVLPGDALAAGAATGGLFTAAVAVACAWGTHRRPPDCTALQFCSAAVYCCWRSLRAAAIWVCVTPGSVGQWPSIMSSSVLVMNITVSIAAVTEALGGTLVAMTDCFIASHV